MERETLKASGASQATFVAFLRAKWIVVLLFILFNAYIGMDFAGGVPVLLQGGPVNWGKAGALFFLGMVQAVIYLFLWFRLGRIAWAIVVAWIVIAQLFTMLRS